MSVCVREKSLLTSIGRKGLRLLLRNSNVYRMQWKKHTHTHTHTHTYIHTYTRTNTHTGIEERRARVRSAGSSQRRGRRAPVRYEKEGYFLTTFKGAGEGKGGREGGRGRERDGGKEGFVRNVFFGGGSAIDCM